MNKLQAIGKFLDQPRLINNFTRIVPTVLLTGGVAYTYAHVKNTPDIDKKKELIKSVSVLGLTIPCAVISPRIAPKMAKVISKLCTKAKSSSAHVHPHVHNHGSHCELHDENHGHKHAHVHGENNFSAEKMKSLIDNFLSKRKVSPETYEALQEAKRTVLFPSKIKTVFNELEKDNEGQSFLREFVPDPENIDSKHLNEEIGRLSIMGAITILGGITGGILGDKLTNENLKETIPNKVKEGAYQFLANIFLCNIGAGTALLMMEGAAGKLKNYKKKGIPKEGFSKFHYNFLEKLNPQSKITRAASMTGGIILAGIVFGSAIANVIGKIIIDPLLGQKAKDDKKLAPSHHGHSHSIYSERTPEMLDVGLHVDDVATVAVLSGLKWIEPAIPILYAISGYRAGIGYRNGKE